MSIVPYINQYVERQVKEKRKVVWQNLAEEIASEECSLSKDVRYWLYHNVHRGTIAKLLYIQQVAWHSEWTKKVQHIRFGNMSNEDWLALAPSLELHASIILPKLYRMLHEEDVAVRRKKKKLFGIIPLSIWPSVNENNSVIKQLIVGSEHGSVDPVSKMTDEQFLACISQHCIYVGKEDRYIIRAKGGTEYKSSPYRVWNLRKQLIQLIIEMYSQNFFIIKPVREIVNCH